jgi:signal transduction histidine kinase
MSLVLVLDRRARSRLLTTRLVREAGHRVIAVADAALATDLVLEHGSSLRLIAASIDDPGSAALQRWLSKVASQSRPTLVLYDPSAPAEALRVTLGAAGVRGLERECADTLRALKTAEAEREQLMVRLAGAEEAERERIAADIHDDSLQAMASAVLRLGLLARELPEPAQQDSVRRVALSIEAAIGRLRRLVFELNPPSLSASSLGDALHGYMIEYARETTVSWSLADRLQMQPSEELKQIMFRTAQEALRNVRKHADARHVEILLAPVDDGILLQIKDDGVGFVPQDALQGRPGHIGVPSMRERLRRAGGWLEVRSAPGAGAVVEAWLPKSPQTLRIPEPDPELPAAHDGGRFVR